MRLLGVKDLEKLDMRRARVRKENEGREDKSTLLVYLVFYIIASPTISKGGFSRF